jgi:hypothetical protein
VLTTQLDAGVGERAHITQRNIVVMPRTPVDEIGVVKPKTHVNKPVGFARLEAEALTTPIDEGVGRHVHIIQLKDTVVMPQAPVDEIGVVKPQTHVNTHVERARPACAGGAKQEDARHRVFVNRRMTNYALFRFLLELRATVIAMAMVCGTTQNLGMVA